MSKNIFNIHEYHSRQSHKKALVEKIKYLSASVKAFDENAPKGWCDNEIENTRTELHKLTTLHRIIHAL